MKYIKNIAVYTALIFAGKMMFLDNYIDLGVIDKHYGIVFSILFLVIISCNLFNKKLQIQMELHPDAKIYITQENMKNKGVIYKLFDYSNIIVDRVFWGYYLLMFIYRFFIGKEIPILLSYLFFLLFGLFLGYKLAREAYDYLKAHQE